MKRKPMGFTIIEVLIVLAIAGLILIIVLLAVPNLQRNNRNTQLRADANNLLGYVNEYTNGGNYLFESYGLGSTGKGAVAVNGS